MDRKKLFLFGIGLLIVTVFVSFFAIIRPTPITSRTSSTVTENSSVKVAIVNEDVGTDYNGQHINMSSILLEAFAKKTKYNFETVSRAIAEKGLENDTYQLMIILPSKFSEESLALESSNPSKAIFQYKIKSDKQLTTKQAEQVVSDFKSHLNEDLIHIYFLSIVGNLQTAQNQVATVVDEEGKSISSFNQLLFTPLVSYSQLFTGLESSPQNILSSFSAFNKDINNTNISFASIIDVNKTYEGEIKQIQSLQDAWTNSIEVRENSLSDYDKEFSNLSVEDQLRALTDINKHVNDKLTEPEVWKTTTEQATKYNEDLKSLIQRFKDLNGEVDTTFQDYDSKINTAIDESLKNNLKDSSGMETTLGSYLTALNQRMLDKVNAKWPTYYLNDAAIDSLNLSSSDAQYLKNISAAIQWYSKEYGQPLPAVRETSNQSDYFASVRQNISNELQTIKSLSFTGIKGKQTHIDIQIPPQYEINISGYAVTKVANGQYQVLLANNESDTLNLQYSLLANPNDISVLEPVFVKAKLYTTEEVEVVKPGEVDDTTKETTSTTDTTVAPATSGTEAPATTTSTDSSSKVVTKVIERTIKNKTESKTVERTYSTDSSISIANAYKLGDSNNQLYSDVKAYLEFAGIADSIFDLKLSSGSLDVSSIKPGDTALISDKDKVNLKTIVAQLIKESTIGALKNDLKFSDEDIKKLEERLLNSDNLIANIDGLRNSTADLNTQMGTILTEVDKVHRTINAKPVLKETEKRDNTDLVTVSLDMNNDLSKLMDASHTLMENTKSNQSVASSIESSMAQFVSEVSNLEKEGSALSEKVTELKNIMTGTYNSNSEFLKEFSTVLSNTKSGNEKNDAVYEYLSNPADASKINNLVEEKLQTQTQRQDERSGLLIILISYLVSLSIVYFLQHADIEKIQNRFNIKHRINWKNASGPMLYLTVMGGVAGIIVGFVSGIKLDFSVIDVLQFGVILSVVTLLFTYGINLLIEKSKSLGFLISILLLMIYIVTATQLFDAYYVNSTQFLSSISPLTYIERFLRELINHQGSWLFVLLLLGVPTGLFGFSNAFIYRKLVSKRV